jgi:hypothetical protein
MLKELAGQLAQLINGVVCRVIIDRIGKQMMTAVSSGLLMIRYNESKFRLYRMIRRLILSKIAMKSIL